MLSIKSLFLFLLLSKQLWSQHLPAPSGKFSIGHCRLEWLDKTRMDILSKDSSFRRLVADIWYPSDVVGDSAVPYLDTGAVNRTLGTGALGSFLGKEATQLILAGRIHTHAYSNATFTKRLRSAPVIFFSHGMGMITQAYTTQIVDLASHGYVVVALTHPHDAWLISFKDGTHLPFETKERQAAGDSEEEHIRYENKRIEWWAGDIRFALDQLALINTSKSGHIPFAGRLNLSRVGAMGHSAGGRAAARACQLDPRIKSCADQDGVAMMQPFYLKSDSSGMKQPFLLFERVRNVPPEENDAASLGMTSEQLNELVNDLRLRKLKALKATGKSYHLLLQFDSSNHMSFSDLPVLQAKNSIQYASAYKILQVTCRYTREFFDKTLLAVPSTLFDSNTQLPYIESLKIYRNDIH